ncbi:MAG: nickel-dependent lactate racemase [Anaerolineales bacterium]|nr:nickel-dependent lactate racemase [Anaerolineales bacterium]
MQIQLPYGYTHLKLEIPDTHPVDLLSAPNPNAASDPASTVQAALEQLVGGLQWSDFASARSVAIAVNDKTRPVPHQYLLPPLLTHLARLGIPDQAIRLFVAVGTHPPMKPSEFSAILPASVLSRYAVVSHDAEASSNLAYLGQTEGGTPVWVNKEYLQADLKIVVGNIEPHQFVGFSGGVKTAAIGLAGLETINHNHALMTHPASKLGEYHDNPARQDVEAIGEKIGIHLAVNAILNRKKDIIQVLAGEPRAVMLAGIPLARQACQVPVAQSYGLVIASPGGHPKDINVYQSQKGLAHAALVTRTGGTVILAAACPEGSGSPHYEDWMPGKTSYQQVLQAFQAEGFRIGPHKAYQIARDASRVRLHWYSKLDRELAERLLLNPVDDLQNIIDQALAELQPGEHIGVLPHAAAAIPYLADGKG